MLAVTPDLNGFLTLARNGSRASASNEEHSAYRLATAILDDVSVLDESALRGLTTFIGITKIAPQTARELLERA